MVCMYSHSLSWSKNAMLKSQKRVWTGNCSVLNSVNARRRTMSRAFTTFSSRENGCSWSSVKSCSFSQGVRLTVQSSSTLLLPPHSSSTYRLWPLQSQSSKNSMEEVSSSSSSLFAKLCSRLVRPTLLVLAVKEKVLIFLCIKSSKACDEQS